MRGWADEGNNLYGHHNVLERKQRKMRMEDEFTMSTESGEFPDEEWE